MLALIQAHILILLHPFIPFFTEKVWLDFKYNNYFKTSLMFKDWDLLKQSNFSKNYNEIEWLINLVSSIRSTKVELNVAPGTFIDISTSELSPKKDKIIKGNLNLFKRLGRITNVNNLTVNKNEIKIIVDGETITLLFDQNLDFNELKQKITSKVKNLSDKILIISGKLKNKSFLKNAPKQIVDNEKKTLISYDIELKKLNSILNSIKN
jgi:valyl-tRNA synthetase